MSSEQQQQAPSHTKHTYQAATSVIHIEHPAASYQQAGCYHIIASSSKQSGKQPHQPAISHTNKQVGSNTHQAIRQSATAISHSKQQAATASSHIIARRARRSSYSKQLDCSSRTACLCLWITGLLGAGVACAATHLERDCR
jgi:hypothetical protein